MTDKVLVICGMTTHGSSLMQVCIRGVCVLPRQQGVQIYSVAYSVGVKAELERSIEDVCTRN